MEHALSLNKKITLSLAALLMSVILLGMRGAVLLSLLPSLVSLSFGLLPMVMAPMVPFIIMGNIILVYVFNLLREKNFFLGLIPGALLKFSFLFLISNFVISFFVKQAVADKVALMMSYPQLITALMGGLLVYLLTYKYNKNN